MLCSLGETGEANLNPNGHPVGHFMCCNVICDRLDPSRQVLTEGGSFWTNSISELLVHDGGSGLQGGSPGGCHGQGYESVALIPLCKGKGSLGLLRLRDRGKGRFTPELVRLWERLAGHLGVALAKFRTEAALRKSQELLQAVINGTSDAIYVKDLNDRYLLLNKEAARFSGVNADLVVGKDEFVLFEAGAAKSFREQDREVIASGNKKSFKELVADATGKIFTFLSTKGPLFDGEQNITGIFGISHNVTDLVQAEEALLINQEQLRSLAIELALVEERERRRLATELHDEIGQNLAWPKSSWMKFLIPGSLPIV